MQYAGLTLSEATGYINDIGPGIFLAPVKGLGTGYEYVQSAQGFMEKKARIATVASFMAMSTRATFTDPATNAAAGGTIATFIAHMRSIIEKSKHNGTGVLIITISYSVLPRITKTSWNYDKKLISKRRKRNQSKLILKQARFIVYYLLIKKSYYL